MVNHLLTLIVFLPLVGAIAVLFFPNDGKRLIYKYITIVTGVLTFFLSLILIVHFDSRISGVQFVEKYAWISTLNISYLIGVDGLSVFLIPLTALLFLLAFVASWDRKDGVQGYFAFFLFLETGILGTFVAQDLFLFFAFWEATLLPIYFMLGVWGNEKRETAATKFFLYQLSGSALILLGMLAIYYVGSHQTFSLLELGSQRFRDMRLELWGRSWRAEGVVFLTMLIGFAVRLPIVPLHSWFPLVQAEAPTPLAVIIASVFLETAAYAIVRINYGLFPASAEVLSYGLAAAGILNVIYGGFCALAQRDIRRLVAFCCVSHVGFILLGLASFSPTAFSGALLQLVSYGLYAGLLFFLVGILGLRSGQYNLVARDGSSVFGGLVASAPLLTGFFTVAVFSAIGVPGLGAFPSQLLVLLGAFPIHKMLTILGLAGIVLTSVYLLYMYRQIFFGASGEKSKDVTDLTVLEQTFLVPLVLLSLFIGVYPSPIVKTAQTTVNQILAALR